MAGSSAAIRAGKAFVEIGAKDKLSRTLDRLGRRMRAFGAGVQEVGLRIARMGAVAAAPFAAGVLTFGRFEKAMSRVGAISGATAEELSALEAEARRLGSATVFSASQAAEAMGFFALAGFSVDQMLKAIGPTLDLAAAGQLELAESADIVAKIMAGMGIAAQDVGGAVDVLTKAMTTANTDLLQLGDAMKFVGPIAKSAGVRFEEIVAAVQMLSNAGIQGEMAGTTLRGALLALTSPSKEASQVLSGLGVSVLDAGGNVRSLAAILGDLERATAGMGSGQKLEVLGRVFDARQAAGMAELLSQGSARLREFTAALGDSSGTAARIAGKQLDNLAGDVVILRSALDEAGISIGEVFGPLLRSVSKGVTKAIDQFSKWAKENRGLVYAVGLAATGVVGLGVALVGTAIAIKIAGIAVSVFAVILGTAVALTKLLILSFVAMASPVGFLAAAIGTLGAALMLNFGNRGKVIDWLGDRFKELKTTAKTALAGITDALKAGDLKLAAEIAMAGMKVAFVQGLNAVMNVFRDFMTGIQAEFAKLGASIKSFWVEIVAGSKTAYALFSDWLSKRWIEQQDIMPEAMMSAKQAVSEGTLDRIGTIASDAEKKLEGIADAKDGELDALGKAQESAEKAAELELLIAKSRLNNLRRRARLARMQEDKDRQQKGPKSSGSGGDTDMDGISEAIKKQVSAVVTFNPAAAAGFGVTGPIERTAKAAERIDKGVIRLIQLMPRNGTRFT